MGKFDAFNKAIDRKQIDEAKESANSFSLETPDGDYVAKIDKMEIGATKDGRPMFKVQMRLVDSDGEAEQEYLSHFKNKKPCVFMNRVIAGTVNDTNMIASVEGWLANLDCSVLFTGNYDVFADEIADAFEDVADLEVGITYEKDRFNSITITDIFE